MLTIPGQKSLAVFSFELRDEIFFGIRTGKIEIGLPEILFEDSGIRVFPCKIRAVCTVIDFLCKFLDFVKVCRFECST